MAAKPMTLLPAIPATNEETEKDASSLEQTIVFWGKEAYKLPSKVNSTSPKN